MQYLFAFVIGSTTFFYEIIWMRYLGLVLGNTVQAAAITAAVFIAGIGIGSFYFGKKADRVKDNLKLFSKIQFGTGISAAIALLLLSNLPRIFISVNNHSGASMIFTIIIGSLFILIPAIFTGGAFPVLAKSMIQHQSKIKRQFALLYAVNTLGNISGIIITSFLLIRMLGMIGTQLVAIGLNLMVALTAHIHASEPEQDRILQSHIAVPVLDMHSLKYMIVALVMGFNSLGLEILWTRISNTYLPNTTYGFSLVLIMYLCGIALGSYIYGYFLSARFKARSVLITSLIATGTYMILSIWIINKIPGFMNIFRPIMDVAILRLTFPGIFVIGILSFIPTVFMGISFPALISLYTVDTQHLGGRIGLIFAVNVIGNILGSIAAGFLVINLLGVIKGIILIGLFALLISLYLGIASGLKHWNKTQVYINGLLIIFSAVILISKIAPVNIVPPSLSHRNQTDLLYYRETSAGTVVVSAEKETGIKACHVNNSAVIGTSFDALITVKMLGYLPCMYKPDAQSALVIGFGTGVTASILSRHKIETLDCVEICPGVKDAAVFFSEFNDSILFHDRINFFSGDGRTYVMKSRKKYDIISCDPTHPVLGSNNLYTLEYFRLCRRILNDNGIICQYLPLHKLTDREFRCLIKTFTAVFPNSAIWLAHSHGILIGGKGTLSINLDQIVQDLSTYPDQYLEDPFFVGASYMFKPTKTGELTMKAALNTDDHPILEFFDPACLKPENWYKNFTTLLALRTNADDVFNITDDRDCFHRYWIGNHYFFASLIHKGRGELDEMLKNLKLAREMNPENRIIERFLAAEITRFPKTSPIDN